MRKKGFTLVELLAAIVLLGIIIAIAVPKYNKYIAKSKINTFRETLSGLYRSVEIYVAEHVCITMGGHNVKDYIWRTSRKIF